MLAYVDRAAPHEVLSKALQITIPLPHDLARMCSGKQNTKKQIAG